MGIKIVRYSEAFKMQVLCELESGKLGSVSEAMERYGIRGGGTVHRWISKYGRNKLRNRIIRVETPKDQDQVKVLKKRIRDLEKVLADTQVNAVLNEAFFRIACEHHGEDSEAFKKKHEAKL